MKISNLAPTYRPGVLPAQPISTSWPKACREKACREQNPARIALLSLLSASSFLSLFLNAFFHHGKQLVKSVGEQFYPIISQLRGDFFH